MAFSNSVNIDFLRSALVKESPLMPLEDFFQWIKKRRDAIEVNIDHITFDEMEQWDFDTQTGNLVHDSGKFFSIEGIQVQTDWGKVSEWSQPIINQPEIGFLAIITKKFDGILHFLMQAKIEPGNINYVQLSPTLQATKSNYTKVHKGKTPLYLEYFNGDKKCNKKIILDQLQSEQGARFIKKRNRNIIIQIEDDIEVYEDFCWLTLGQIKELLRHDNVVNMDSRTVISGIPFGNYNNEVIEFYKTYNAFNSQSSDYELGMLLSSVENENHLHEQQDIISWITGLKSTYELEVQSIPLHEVKDWVRDEKSIYHKEKKYFKVIPVRASIANREVKSWTQPLVESAQEGIIAFIVKKINDVYHFLVQAKLEAGNFDIIELAPTVQCLTGNYRKGLNEYEVPYLDYILKQLKTGEGVRYATYQSEEGGRFYREQNRNIIIEADENFDAENLPENFTWMTLNQLQIFIQYNNYLNIQARSLIAAIKFI